MNTSGRTNCSEIPLFELGQKLLSEFSKYSNINLWSLEYLTATYSWLLDVIHIETCNLTREECVKDIIESIVKGYRCNSDRVKELLRESKEFLNKVSSALLSNGYQVREVVMELEGRGVVGTSSDVGRLLFEWGLAFDPYLNLPYIPASTIKGAIRRAYLRVCRKEFKEACEIRAEKLFGSTESPGKIGFTDAYPVECLGKYLLVPDVITPHYVNIKYEKDAMPKPAHYLSIGKGVRFKFFMFYYGGEDIDEELTKDPSSVRSLNDLRILDKALLLSLGLGIGGKTLTGYTHFKLVSYTIKRLR